MGLSIHYSLTASLKLDEDEIRKRVQRTARIVRRIGCAYVGRVLRPDARDPDAPDFFYTAPGCEGPLFRGPRNKRGWLVALWPGKGCDTATFGLYQTYRFVTRLPKGRRRMFLPDYVPVGWRLEVFCKTHYAAEHGIEHFVQCHERGVRLLDLWRGSGVRLRVYDETGFWKTRDRKALAGQIGDHETFLWVARRRVWS